MVKENVMTRLEPDEREQVRKYAERLGRRTGTEVSESAAIRSLVLVGLEQKRER